MLAANVKKKINKWTCAHWGVLTFTCTWHITVLLNEKKYKIVKFIKIAGSLYRKVSAINLSRTGRKFTTCGFTKYRL